MFKVDLSMYEWLLQPVNINKNHWALLAANVKQKKISLLDSMGNAGLPYISKWK